MTSNKLEIRAVDGARIDAVFNKNETRPVSGVVVFCHGFGEHSGNYKQITQKLAMGGYASIAYDQRGHGDLRPVERLRKLQGVIPGYRYFLDDIASVIDTAKELAPDVPVVLYGHSMGGNIVLNYLLKNGQEICTCVVLESPWLGLHKELNALVKFLVKLSGKISRRIAIINKLSPSDLTGDAEIAGGYKTDEFYHNRMSMRMLTGVLNGCNNALENASRFLIPIYIAYAKHDVIVSNEAIGRFIGDAGENVLHKEYNSHHAIRNDKDRETLFTDVLGFLNSNLSD